MRRRWRSSGTPTWCRSTRGTGRTRRSRGSSTTTATCTAAGRRHEERGRGAGGRARRAGPVAGSGHAETCGSWPSPTRRTAWPTSACAGCSSPDPTSGPTWRSTRAAGELLALADGRTMATVGVGEKGTLPGARDGRRRGRPRLDAERRRQRRPAARASCCAGSAAGCPTRARRPGSRRRAGRAGRRRRRGGHGAAPDPGRAAPGDGRDHHGADPARRARPSGT